MRLFLFLVILGCSTSSPQKTPLPEWIGKSRDEVKEAFSHLTPKTEKDRITYRDSDPILSPARCSVVPCYPWIPGRINCTYEFRIKDNRVTKATRSGVCRD